MRPLSGGQWQARLFFALAASFFADFPSAAFAAPAEVRGTWVSTTGYTATTSAIYTPAITANTWQRLRNIGINTVYMDIWRNGNTYYNSPTNAAITGNLRDPATINSGRDFLAEAVLQSRRQQMSVFGWFQYGLQASFGNPSTSNTTVSGYFRNRGWLLQDSAGNYTNSSTGFTWLNPLVPEVKTYITNLLLDAVNNYNIQGIQFDDHVAWPVQFGYDSYTRAQYLAETGRALPTSYTDTNFMTWRAGKVTQFVTDVVAAVRAARPGIIVSLSPSVYPFSYDNYLVNWPDWVQRGIFDEYIPQVYRSTTTDFNRDWSSSTSGQTRWATGSNQKDLGAGIAINLTAGTPAFTTIQSEISASRSSAGYAGHALWFVDGVFTYESNLTSYYNVAQLGQANRPDYANNDGIAPVNGTLVSGTIFDFAVPYSALYDIAYLDSNSVWRIFQSNVPAGFGTYRVSVPGALQAQLLYSTNLGLVPEPGGVAVVVASGLVLLRRRAA